MTTRKHYPSLALLCMSGLALPLQGVAQTWDICVYDPSYTAEYQFSIEQNRLIRGLAYAGNPPNPDFPAPLTGTYLPSLNSYQFTIGYLNTNASRYYWIDGNTGQGYGWAVLENAEYYDSPRPAQLRRCESDAAGGGAERAATSATGAP